MAIQIDTIAVMNTADQIDAANKQISSDLADLDAAIRNMQQNWQGEAANSCANKYSYIKNSFADARFGVVNNLVVFMKTQVGAAYDAVDREVALTASAFFK